MYHVCHDDYNSNWLFQSVLCVVFVCFLVCTWSYHTASIPSRRVAMVILVAQDSRTVHGCSETELTLITSCYHTFHELLYFVMRIILPKSSKSKRGTVVLLVLYFIMFCHMDHYNYISNYSRKHHPRYPSFRWSSYAFPIIPSSLSSPHSPTVHLLSHLRKEKYFHSSSRHLKSKFIQRRKLRHPVNTHRETAAVD
jgi:hypothetical protein